MKVTKKYIKKIVTEAILKEEHGFSEFARVMSQQEAMDYIAKHGEPKTIEKVNELILGTIITKGGMKTGYGFPFFAQNRFKKLLNNNSVQTKVLPDNNYYCYVKGFSNGKNYVEIFGRIKYTFNNTLIKNIQNLYLTVRNNGCKIIETKYF